MSSLAKLAEGKQLIRDEESDSLPRTLCTAWTNFRQTMMRKKMNTLISVYRFVGLRMVVIDAVYRPFDSEMKKDCSPTIFGLPGRHVQRDHKMEELLCRPATGCPD